MIESDLLKLLGDSKGYVACDGPDRATAHALEKQGLAAWKGSSWGSQFWAITEAGRLAISQSKGSDVRGSR
jgi:hypothetical protein